ncbi:MAG: diguanylate cyclase [Pseudomonadales bacterium]|nr:diguanylate cyclase [Pseudomonadales bacterium]
MLFVRLGGDAGLSQGSVMAITHDSKGFIWLGTEDGLTRYDGFEPDHIVRDRRNPDGLPNNWITAIERHSDGRLFIGTGGGVVWRDPLSGKFFSPVDSQGQPLIDAQANVRALHLDQSNRLWVGLRATGLVAIDLTNWTKLEIRHTAEQPSLSDDSVTAIAASDADSVWVGTRSGLDRIDATGHVIAQLGPRLQQALGVRSPVAINALLVERRGLLWIGTDSGLFSFDPVGDELIRLRADAADPKSLPSNRVTVLLEDDEQRLWVGTAAGLALLDRRTNSFSTSRFDPADPASLPDSFIVSLHQDTGGMLWVGTKAGGTARWNPHSWSFGHRRLGSASNNVASFAEDSNGRLWIGTIGSGLFQVNATTGVATPFRVAPGSPVQLLDSNVMALVADDNDHIWAGTMRSGVIRIDIKSGAATAIPIDEHDLDALPVPGVMALLRDSRGQIWVGTFGGGVVRIDPHSLKVTRFPIARDGTQGLPSDRATALAEDRNGWIWIGTDGGGLSALNPGSGEFQSYVHSPDDPMSLGSNTVYSIHLDPAGQLWVGTRGGGLDRVVGSPQNKGSVSFENVAESEGLPNSTVYGVESDGRDTLWISTNRGLVRFEPATRNIRTYLRSNGLQGDEFNFGAHFRSASGQLYFGGANGYNAFAPERLRFNDHPPPVTLTGLLKFNTPAVLPVTYDSINSIDLGYRDDVVTFEFAALDFTSPQNNRYSYRLSGFDADWVDAGNKRQATYTNLDGGKYVFEVRAANSDGAWNEQGLSIPVNVEAPPWARWWAYPIYALALFAIMYAVWAQQQKKVRREAAYARRLAEEVDQRTRELAERNEQLEHANVQLQEASFSDALTGLGNRRALYDNINNLLTEDSDQHFVVMIIDLDRLKPINDQYGHEAGDRVLEQIADILRRVSRASDQLIRWGGDEFVILCRDANLTVAASLAERIRESIAKQLFRVSVSSVARTSCSIGFAPYPFISAAPELGNWEQSLAFADAALYQAKRERNNWIGWAGTERAAGVTQLVQAVERDADALIKEGCLEVRRREVATDDTVDRILALRHAD